VPAVAVIQEGPALFIIIGRKGYVGCFYTFFLIFAWFSKGLILDLYNLSLLRDSRIFKRGV